MTSAPDSTASPPSTLAPAATLRDARAAYFAANGFGDGGYADRWVWLKVGPIPIAFPNSPGRVRAVRFHDLHHVLTGYATTWTGEAEIGAWEIGSSCADHWAAWFLNLNALAVGLLIAPRSVWRAFVRGRATGNLYRETWDDALLARSVSDERARLRLDAPQPAASASDRLAFFGWSLLSFVALLAMSWPLVGLFGAVLWFALHRA